MEPLFNSVLALSSVGNDVFFTNQRLYIVELAAHHALPAMYAFHFEVECLGGNTATGPEVPSRQLAGRIIGCGSIKHSHTRV